MSSAMQPSTTGLWRTKARPSRTACQLGARRSWISRSGRTKARPIRLPADEHAVGGVGRLDARRRDQEAAERRAGGEGERRRGRASR